jgi:hypothetical protein
MPMPTKTTPKSTIQTQPGIEAPPAAAAVSGLLVAEDAKALVGAALLEILLSLPVLPCARAEPPAPVETVGLEPVERATVVPVLLATVPVLERATVPVLVVWCARNSGAAVVRDDCMFCRAHITGGESRAANRETAARDHCVTCRGAAYEVGSRTSATAARRRHSGA